VGTVAFGLFTLLIGYQFFLDLKLRELLVTGSLGIVAVISGIALRWNWGQPFLVRL
jgi:hypothetical protein